MFVCMYVCVYVCMHACMHVWMDGWTDGWMHVCMCACMPMVFSEDDPRTFQDSPKSDFGAPKTLQDLPRNDFDSFWEPFCSMRSWETLFLLTVKWFIENERFASTKHSKSQFESFSNTDKTKHWLNICLCTCFAGNEARRQSGSQHPSRPSQDRLWAPQILPEPSQDAPDPPKDIARDST